MLCGAAILVCAAACAQPPQASGPPAPAKQEEKGKEDKKPPEEKVSQTRHTIQIGGKDVKYTATAGTMLLKKEDGTATASIFYIAYIKDDVPDTTKRPLTFAFNGGPGSSSVWLQLGALGPKRVAMDPEGNALPPPYKLVDNEYSILDLTDLVFIDPVSTGFSRAIPEQDAKNFHGINGDLESVADFIRLYTTRNSRWTSPKFLAGESYGTTRSAELSSVLQQRHQIYLNGIVLVSSVAFANWGADDRSKFFLPTYVTSAWYHHLLPPDLQKETVEAVAQAARQFAHGDYAAALEKGDSCPRPSIRRRSRSWRASRAFRRSISRRPTCASAPTAGSRNSSATSAARWAAWIRVSKAWTWTPPARPPNTIRARPPTRARMSPCSRITCAAS